MTSSGGAPTTPRSRNPAPLHMGPTAVFRDSLASRNPPLDSREQFLGTDSLNVSRVKHLPRKLVGLAVAVPWLVRHQGFTAHERLLLGHPFSMFLRSTCLPC